MAFLYHTVQMDNIRASLKDGAVFNVFPLQVASALAS
jgi:hypothetical protein